ncbi:MoaD/ThiS family protein [Methanoregula sp.]|uniref:MoaD/ThiS family protein n=1 Tax=Methanoregula sp. TaxID=2052170 RepID=UPI003BAEF39E
MKIKVRFFSDFGELFGNEVIVDAKEGSVLSDLIANVSGKNKEGYDAIFDAKGNIREFVVLVRNSKQIDMTESGKTTVAEGDDIVVLPPISGG